MWAEKLQDMSGEPVLKLRTTVPGQQVPGAAEGLLARKEPIPPERIQYQNPETGSWSPVKRMLKTPEPVGAPPVNEKQMRLLAALLAASGGANLSRE